MPCSPVAVGPGYGHPTAELGAVDAFPAQVLESSWSVVGSGTGIAEACLHPERLVADDHLHPQRRLRVQPEVADWEASCFGSDWAVETVEAESFAVGDVVVGSVVEVAAAVG